MHKVSKKSLKSSKKDNVNIEKKMKSQFKKVQKETVSEDSSSKFIAVIEDNLKEIRDSIDIKNVETIDAESPEIMETDQNNNSKKNKVIVSNCNTQKPVPNKRVLIIKNISNNSKIDDVLSNFKNKDDIVKFSSIKVRNRGVKTQMLTIEFKTAHCTEALLRKLNDSMLDGNKLLVEYKYNVVNTDQYPSTEKTDTFIIKNLPLSSTKDSIKELIKDFDVSAKNIQIYKKSGKNTCFIKFNTTTEASEAFEILKTEIVEGVKLDLKFVSEKKELAEELSTTKLHISNLPFNVNKSVLEKEFDMADSIKIPLKGRGKTKGCCYLSFKSKEMAALALDALQDKVIDGRPIRCEYANVNVVVDNAEETEESATGTKKRVRSKANPKDKSTVTLFNLPTTATSDDISAKFANVESVKIMKKGIAEVIFDNISSAKSAIKAAAFSMEGREIRKEFKGKKTDTKPKATPEPMES